MEKAQNLNPNVKVKSVSYSLTSYKETDNFDVISEFDVVCLTGSTCKVRNILKLFISYTVNFDFITKFNLLVIDI